MQLWSTLSHVQCILKEGGIIVVPNEKGELVYMRMVSEWGVCIDYQKLNLGTIKGHLPILFMVQLLDWLSEKRWYCFLDGYYG